MVYSQALTTFSGSVFFSIMFFLMIITLGLDSTVRAFGVCEMNYSSGQGSDPLVVRSNASHPRRVSLRSAFGNQNGLHSPKLANETVMPLRNVLRDLTSCVETATRSTAL